MKKFVSYVLAFSLLVGLLVVVSPRFSAADSLYARKVVSIVYDDSGSMLGGDKEGVKEAYANYALQSFCGISSASRAMLSRS